MPANEKRHVFTYQMRVAVSPEQDEMLREYAARFGRVERTLYWDLENGEDANRLKSAYRPQHANRFQNRSGNVGIKCHSLRNGDSMVFVLDNYDSFTYNLVQYLGELGARIEVRRNDQVSVAEVEALRPDRIVVSPGPCTPQEAGISIELIRHFTGKVPVLGVCLGHQALGAAFGGKVVRAKNLMHGKTSQVEHDGKTIFRGLESPMTATRYHSLIVSDRELPADLETSAYTTERDGTRVIMGLRHRKFPVEGVQFHPESVLTDQGRKLIANFLAL
jgi:anthranilate synthase/aminodeoxychorismate synthase-like glutamine amidotransferase